MPPLADTRPPAASELLGRRDLVVVGAGPTGIAALWFARRHGLSATAVDASASPLASVRAFSPGLVTASNALEWEVDGLPVDCRSATEITREDLLSYYARVVSYGQLAVACRQRMAGITPGQTGGEVRVDVQSEHGQGYWLAKHVLVTPWYRRRVLDLGDPRVTGVTVHRALDVTSVLGDEIVVVGGGLSGLEACDALLRAGRRITLASRASRPLPPELATLFAVSGSRYVKGVTRLTVASRGVLAIEATEQAPMTVACSAAFDCTGQEANHDLLGVLERAELLSATELGELRPFHRPTLLDTRDLKELAARLPNLADAIWSGRRGVRFAGTVFHVGGVFGAGVVYSIETAKWAVESMAGVTAPDAPARDVHLPSLFLSSARDETFPDRRSPWSDHFAAIVPIPIPSLSRGTKILEGERTTGVLGPGVSHESRAHGDARSDALTQLRDACYEGLSVAKLGEKLDLDREDLQWGLRTLWQNNGLTWVPPGQTQAAPAKVAEAPVVAEADDFEEEGPPTQARPFMQAPPTLPIPSALLLTVMSPEGVFNVPLPLIGEVTIGRSASCDVNIEDIKASRLHAVLSLGPPIQIVDRGSMNGTLVSDQRLEPNVPLGIALGAMITIGSTVLVLQHAHAEAAPKRIWSQAAIEARIAEEERLARVDGAQFAIVRVRLSEADPAAPRPKEDLDEILDQSLRPTDAIGVLEGGVFEILLPRTVPDVARAIATLLRARLHEAGIAADVGGASYPRDGATVSALEARVRAPAPAHEDEEDEPPKSVQFDRDAMDRLAPLVQKIASSMINVLILGETGVGKEVMARSIHEKSARATGPMVTFNCAAFSESLLESELFGHEKGAFTGALQAKPGLLESAEGGTVFLDEVGEMPLSLQAKLLRVLEQREVQRVGALKPRAIDVRFIAATNRHLEEEIRARRFREDLYFRLNGMSLTIPPLRERLLSIDALARAFVAQASDLSRREPPAIAPAVTALLRTYRWPGNIRELRNVMERAVLLCSGDTITLEHVPIEKMGAVVIGTRGSERPPGMTVPPPPPPAPLTAGTPLEPSTSRTGAPEGERARILEALERCAGNQTKAASLLGISRRTLVTRLSEYDIPRPRKR